MAESTFFTITRGPLSAAYKIMRDGEPVYETYFFAGKLEFRSPGEDDPVLVLEPPDAFEYITGMNYRLTDLETDETVGDLGDDVALFGRRWAITNPDGERAALIRTKGKWGALLHEFALAKYVTGPATMEIVGAGERPVGAIERSVGVHDRITVSVDDDAGFDPRLAMAAAVLFDAADREDARIGRRVAERMDR